MNKASFLPLGSEWKALLGLAHRSAPEFYESAETVIDVPHAAAIRTALTEMGLSAVFCVQNIPTVAIFVSDDYDPTRITDLHGALWNQGLASLLLVITNDTLRVFSLARTPLNDLGDVFETRCLIDSLSLTAQALQFQNFIYGAESGRLWRDYNAFFQPKERIDQVLLDNLSASHKLLQATNLESDAAQAVLMQVMFIAYLEDREIITPDYFSTISGNRINSFSALLETGDVNLFHALFRTLRQDFNGNLFVAPCSFEPEAIVPEITSDHLTILSRFRSGREEMAHSAQQRFWGYDFRYIPIELVSAVYDRFLGERETERRSNGAYYTPMFLADTVVSQIWEILPSEIREEGRFLDPACGSGVFLVRSFQRLCEHWRATHKAQTISWKMLLSLLNKIHGWDLNGGAVRVAVFSLYVALLEEVSPRDIRKLITRGKILPEIWGKSLVCQDFFEVESTTAQYEVIIGNPPWTSRRGPERSSVQWSKKTGHPIPGGEDAWAFSWKALEHLSDKGRIAFLLPSMGFLHNHTPKTVEVRNLFFSKSRVCRVINFADLRFQLFEKAHRPASLIIYSKKLEENFPYKFDYWAPKADLNLYIKRIITLSSADKVVLGVGAVLENPLIFKQRLWMHEPDAKLFNYLDRFPKLGDFISDFGSLSRRRERRIGNQWIIGQGYQPFKEKDETEEYKGENAPPLQSEHVGQLPDLPIKAFSRLAQVAKWLNPAHSPIVRRRGFEAGFEGGVRILIPRGVETAQNRLRAAYCDEPLTFQHIIQAIVVPNNDSNRAKTLTAILNSRLAVWYAFHGTASFGADRPEVQQADLLRLPFPSPDDLPDKEAAVDAARQLVKIIDNATECAKKEFSAQGDESKLLQEIDRLSYQYFCLSSDEISIIEDTVESILPALQPHEGHFPKLWGAPDEALRSQYANTLAASLTAWFRDQVISARLIAQSPDLAVLRLQLGRHENYEEERVGDLSAVLQQLFEHIHFPLTGNFQLMPDLRIFVGENLYLIKPMQTRFWLRSTALADADEIALDFQRKIVSPPGMRGH